MSNVRVKDVDSTNCDYEQKRKVEAKIETFPELDREQEDSDIVEFQKTQDLKLLEKAFIKRIPTLKVWSKQNFYPGLISSEDDLFAELSYVFVKAATKYDSSRGSFNTLLYTFFLNRIKNLKSSRYAKKRRSDEFAESLSGMILSLDYSYNDKDGSLLTLKDMLPNEETTDKAYISKSVTLEETVRILSSDDPVLKSFFMKLSEGDSMASLLKQYRTRKGEIYIDNDSAKKLKRYKCKKIVSDLIKEEVLGDFKLLDYMVEDNNTLTYQVELKKTEETDKIVKALRNIKKNKDSLVSRIRGPKEEE